MFYTAGDDANVYDPGFNKNIRWDVPLLDGYEYEWAINTSKQPGSHHFKGVVNPGLIGQVNAWHPTAILLIGWAYKSHLKLMRYYKNKLPVYFRGDSTLLDEKSGIKQLVRSIMLKWVYSHISHAFYTGTNSHAYFTKYGLADKQLTFAPHAVDNERFGADRRAEAGELRLSFGISETNILILFAGKLNDKKAPGLLLSAFLKIERTDVHLLFTGDGELKQELNNKADGKK